MINYRNGDQVLFETDALIVESGPEGIIIQFGDIKLRTEPDTLSMVKRSVHVGDTVWHGEEKAFVSQTLEEGVFLIRLSGKSGANGFRVVGFDELRHADEPARTSATVERTAPAAEPATTVAPAAQPAAQPAPAPAPQPVPEPATGAVADELLLTTPIAPDAEPSANEQAADVEAPAEEIEEPAPPATSGGVAAMASSLTGLIGRRRNLDHLGPTQEVKPVTATDDDVAAE